MALGCVKAFALGSIGSLLPNCKDVFPVFCAPASWMKTFRCPVGRLKQETQRTVPPRCEKRTSPYKFQSLFLGKWKRKRLQLASHIARFHYLSIIEGDSSRNTLILRKSPLQVPTCFLNPARNYLDCLWKSPYQVLEARLFMQMLSVWYTSPHDMISLGS